jgi:hypothetical protein
VADSDEAIGVVGGAGIEEDGVQLDPAARRLRLDAGGVAIDVGLSD